MMRLPSVTHVGPILLLLLVVPTLLLSLLPYVHADLPIHCLNLHVAGAWTFSLSAGGGTNTTTTCGFVAPDTNAQHFADPTVFDFDTASTYQVVLARPATAYDSEGNTGVWTMIYDEGFEVRINERVFFAFMSYSPNSGVNTNYESDVSEYTSNCAATMTGWYRNADNTDWGCWSGEKYTETDDFTLAPSGAFSWAKAEDVSTTNVVSSQSSLATEHVVSQTSDVDVDAVFKPDHKFVARVNRDKKKTWHAKVHKQFEGKKVREMLSLAGASRSKKSVAPHQKKHVKAEAKAKRGAKRLTAMKSTLLSSTSVPDTFDWRDVDGVNYVTPVVNQGNCGSCYAVASAAAYESRFRVASDNVLQPFLSAQEILSCSITNQGCEGGFPFLVAKHGVEQGFVELGAYAYAGTDESCPDLSSATRWHLSDYGYIGGFYGNNSELAMMEEMYNNGPIIIAFESPTALFYYDGGIFDGECDLETESEDSTQMREWEATNHAVIGVGWGVENGVKYWTIKNTWGSSWGEAGYFRIIRGVNECAVESMSVWGTPLITDDLSISRRL